MKIDIAKKDLWWLREIISREVYSMENCPNPSAWSKAPAVGRRANRKLDKAIKKAFGHTCDPANNVLR